jgi:hypothetical protein
MRAGTNPPVAGTGYLWTGFFGSPAVEFDEEPGTFPVNLQKRTSNVPECPNARICPSWRTRWGLGTS